MLKNFNEDLKLLYVVILIEFLIGLGWFLTELHSAKQNLANGYQEFGIKSKSTLEDKNRYFESLKLLQAQLDSTSNRATEFFSRH